MELVSDETQLVPFIAAAKASGTADAFILDLLKASGWSERRVFVAFASYYADALGRSVPTRGFRFEYARDGFFYLLAFISLATWATGAGHLLYVLIDAWFPSTLDTAYARESIRDNSSLELASIIVGYPIFAVVSRSIHRQIVERPESADSGVRKWLTYIALVIAAVVLLCDAIFFLQKFLHGDLTSRFIFDTIVLFGIVGPIFAYYLQTLRAQPIATLRDRFFAAASAVLVIFALSCGFASTGLPERQRLLNFDEQRINDLVMLEYRVRSDYRSTHRIPAVVRPA